MQRMTRKDSKDVAAPNHGTCDLRQENALKNWQRRSVQWQQMEERMAKKLNKDPSQLVMSRIDEYRMLVEERQVIEEARMLSEGKYSFPQCGLKIGSDLVGLSMITQKTAPREIERIATARRENNCIATARGENTLRSESRKGESYMITRRQQLQEAISTLDPMYLVDSVSKLEVEGRGITAKDTQSHENNFVRVKSTVEGEQVLSRKTPSQHSRISTDVKQIEPFEDNLNPNLHSNTETTPRSEASGTAHQNELVRYIGPYLQQSTDICFFNNKTNEMSMANFRIHNRGSTTVHFEWRKKIMANPLNVKTTRNSIRRFYFYNKKGLVLPGETIDFQIIYKSSKPGMFSEIWELDTAPKMPPGCKGIQVKFEGITLETDEVEAARKRIRDTLLRREATNVATEIIDNLFKCVWHKVEFNANNRHVNNDEAEMFKMMNQKLHLRYSRNTLSAFEQLAGDVFRTLHIPPELSIWDKSVMSLNQLILSIPDSSVRSECLKRLNMGIKSSFLPPVQTVTSLLYITGYDVLTDLADKVADASERIRTDLNLPLLRGCTQKLTDLEKELKEDSGITGEAASKSVDSKKLPTSSIPHPTSVESKQKSQASLLPVIAKDATKSKTAVSSRQSSLKAVVKEEDISSLPSRESPTKKLTDLPETWSEDRKAMESLYLRQFQDTVYKLTDKAVDRMHNLFGEIRQEI